MQISNAADTKIHRQTLKISPKYALWSFVLLILLFLMPSSSAHPQPPVLNFEKVVSIVSNADFQVKANTSYGKQPVRSWQDALRREVVIFTPTDTRTEVRDPELGVGLVQRVRRGHSREIEEEGTFSFVSTHDIEKSRVVLLPAHLIQDPDGNRPPLEKIRLRKRGEAGLSGVKIQKIIFPNGNTDHGRRSRSGTSEAAREDWIVAITDEPLPFEVTPFALPTDQDLRVARDLPGTAQFSLHAFHYERESVDSMDSKYWPDRSVGGWDLERPPGNPGYAELAYHGIDAVGMSSGGVITHASLKARDGRPKIIAMHIGEFSRYRNGAMEAYDPNRHWNLSRVVDGEIRRAVEEAERLLTQGVLEDGP